MSMFVALLPNGERDMRFAPMPSEKALWDAVEEWFSMTRKEIENEGVRTASVDG